ncbi:MAG: histidine kinase, partial [Bryobacteraceae bacterium]
MRESLLVNTLGHAAGVVIFGIFVYLLLQDRAAIRLRGSRQSLLAAVLALTWNLASLIVLGLGEVQSLTSDVMVTISFSVLSLLPAVLFDLCLLDRYRKLAAAGYTLSGIAIVLHVLEPFAGPERFHRWALTLITIGFGALAVIAAILVITSSDVRRRGTTSRILGTMALFLLSMSFVHFGGVKHIDYAWSQELAFHHAGIPLALLVLLQDYRFLLLDAFMRFLANVLLSIAIMILGITAAREFGVPDSSDGFALGLWLVAACLLLILFSMLRSLIQGLLTRLAFGRADFDQFLANLKAHEATGGEESQYLGRVNTLMAEFLRAPVSTAGGGLQRALSGLDLHYPTPVADLGGIRTELEEDAVEVVTPVRLVSGEARFLLLGRRNGGRRYLSEDLQALARASSTIAEQMDAHRDAEMRRLMSQAEFRALQSQIHPHFLFNALNTLYGL